MIDFHSHVLPGMDDGSVSVKESLEMLKLSWRTGIDSIVATPHYYAQNESIEHFLNRRQEQYEMLVRAIGGEKDVPQIIMGAETAFFSGISREEDILKLCISGTKYLLLELPFSEWTSLTFKEIQGLVSNRGIVPIIAHIDRYYSMKRRKENIRELLDIGVVIQVNSEAFSDAILKYPVMRMLSKGKIHLLGSDCHNMDENPPNLDIAFKQISKRRGEKFLKAIDATGRKVLRGELIR